MMNLLFYWLLGGRTDHFVPATSIMFFPTTLDNSMIKPKTQPLATKQEIREALMISAENQTPNRFNVRFDSDGSGSCVMLMVERDKGEDSNGRSPFVGWETRPAMFMGWRIVYVHVPDGYIDVFYDSRGNYKGILSYP